MAEQENTDEAKFLEAEVEEEDGAPIRGRPTEFSADLADRICAAIACGSSLRKVCKKTWAPHHKTIFLWFRKHPAFLRSYEVATEIRAEYFADEMIEIADDDSGDWGYKETGDKDGQGARPVLLPDNVKRAQLRIHTRQWNCERMKPKKYGAFVRKEITGKDGGPLGMSLKTITDDQLAEKIQQLADKLGVKPGKES